MSECENGTGGGDDLRKCPLGRRFNLSSKLAEYTWGTMGMRQPFQPGGMDNGDDDAAKYGDDNNSEEDDYNNPLLSEEATKNAQQALTIGSK